MALFILIINACGNAFMVSWVNSFIREVEEGGATSRLRTFLMQSLFLANATGPIYSIFPVTPIWLQLCFYSGLGFIAGINYLAAICHENQLHRNANEPDKVRPLPFGLHNSPRFSRIVLFLANHLSYAINAIYIGGLIASVFFIPPVVALATGSMLLVNYCFQRGWFPKFLEKTYFFFTSFLMFIGTFGLNSILGMAATVTNVVFFIYDYVQTHIRGKRSASSQYVISTPEHHLSLEKELEDKEPTAVEWKMKVLIKELRGRDIRLTFDHFQKSNEVSDKLLGDHPILKDKELKEYETLFESLDFQSPAVRDEIVCQLVVHDNFNAKSDEDYKKEFQLPETATHEDVCVAFMKNEIKNMVTKLSSPDYRGLTAEQISKLYGHVRLILEHLQNPDNAKDKQPILMSLALRTGQQCWRAYVDEFTALGHKYAFNSAVAKANLSLKERAVLAAQTFRENQFVQYYHEFSNFIKTVSPAHTYLWSDTNEYHTYEAFALNYGAYFYLRNPSLSVSRRDLMDIITEKFTYYVFQWAASKSETKMLFSQYYNQDTMIENIAEGGILSPIFQAWCEQISPTYYQEMVLDENGIFKKDLKVRNLIKLMLVDMDLAEFTEPYEPAVEDDMDTAMSPLFDTPRPQPSLAPMPSPYDSPRPPGGAAPAGPFFAPSTPGAPEAPGGPLPVPRF